MSSSGSAAPGVPGPGEAELGQALLDSIGEGVYVVDRDGRLTTMNAVAEELLGWTRDELAGRRVHEAIHPRRPDGSPYPAEECPLLAVATTGAPARVDDDVFVRRDGALLPVACSSSPLRHGDRVVGAVVVFRDISARRRREREERNARVRAELLARAARLSESLDLEEHAQALVRAIAPGLSDYAFLHAGDREAGIRVLAVAHSDPAKEGLVRRLVDGYPPDPDAPVGAPAVIRNGRLQVHEDVTDALLQLVARDEEHLELLRRLGPRSAVVVPLTARGRTFGALSLVSTSGRYSRDTIELAEQVAGQAALLLDNARLLVERSRAVHELQRALIPRALPEIPGVELAASYRPAGEGTEAGGDVFDVLDLGDGTWAVLIADVAGKGAPAAAVTGVVRYTAEGAVTAGAGPADVLRLVNRAVLRHGTEAGFCSAVYGSVTPRGDGGVDVRVRCAGHPPPLRLSGSGRVEEVVCHGPLLGVVADGTWEESHVVLAPGDLLLLYTDGATELRGEDPYRGTRQLAGLLARCAGVSADEVVARVERHVVEASGGEPRDDLALLALRVPPGR